MKEQELKDKIAKLPVWAQEHIKKVERERDNANRIMREGLNKATPSPVYYEDFHWASGNRVEVKQYIQSDRITFEIDKNEFKIALKDGYLELVMHGDHLDDLAVIPVNGNVFRIKAVKEAK